MNYFGEMDRSRIHHIYVRLRYAKLLMRELISGLVIRTAGRIEDLVSAVLPGYRDNLLLPDFFIVGAQKSGTTSLTVWLSQLPDFRLARIKVRYKKYMRLESKFFSDPTVRIRGLKWYSKLYFSGMKNGDKTPEYLSRKSALREIHHYCSGARIIVMLRNPVTRSFSAYQHYCEKLPRDRNWDWLLPGRSFEDNLQAEESTGFPAGFLGRGRYAEQLEFLFTFFPREQVKIVVFERFLADPARHLDEIVSFLEAPPPAIEVEYSHENKGIYRSGLDPETRRNLEDYYKPHNERLFELLGYRIEEWYAE